MSIPNKRLLIPIAVLVLMFIIPWILGIYELAYTKFFSPRAQNIQREVFENTKSYTHGKIQDLARYYRQYKQAKSDADRDAIAEVIRLQFANFDANRIPSFKLRNFLTNIRGY